MQAGSNQVKIDDKTIVMDTMPYMSGTTTYIPLRYLSDGIGAEVA
jgi:hypothetical protein